MAPSQEETKIFGLGLIKTGTSSLAQALGDLGIRTVHYPHDRTTYEEIRTGKYNLSIMKEFQAAVDMPIPEFYGQLDRAYPKSKFILTVRDIDSWLPSVEEQLSVQSDEDFRYIAEFMMACMFGTIEFNVDRMKFVYERHINNVQEYFAARPSDLLIMDIVGGDGWEKLCPFLGIERPSAPFPSANSRTWVRELSEIANEMILLIPPGDTVILVDGSAGCTPIVPGCRVLPFLESNGEYMGEPADDVIAIRELARMQARGANFLIFHWPALWYLDYYHHFHAYLRDKFRVAAESDKVVVFDLRP